MFSYTVQQILAAERIALAEQGQQPLMLRAATAVAVSAAAMLGGRTAGRRVLVLAGSGNNGGDALFASANLARRGLRVTAVLVDPDRAHPAALAALIRAGARTLTWDDPGGDAASRQAGREQVGAAIETADLIIDGLVGIGARPPLRPAAAALVELANAAAAMRLAVDIPSGVDPDGSPAPGPAFAADLTVTFGGAKTGLLLDDRAGEIAVYGLDFPLTAGPHDAVVFGDHDVAALLPAGASDSDKFSAGVVGIFAGSPAYPGAAVLCVGAAVRLRPGLVRYAGPVAAQVLARWPEVVACAEVTQTGRVQAWVAGPGIGTDSAGLAAVNRILDVDVPVLLDADGLTLVAEHPALLSRRHHRGLVTVLTPHAGEFSRLFRDLDPTNRLAAARAAARRSGAVVLLKGHRTVIAAPDGRTAINHSGSPWLATAGSGDVLSGIIGSLLAAGLDPFDAAALGAYLHGRAGQRAEVAGHAGAQALWEYLR